MSKDNFCEVVSKSMLNEDTALIEFSCSEIAEKAVPGQFVNVTCSNFLRRPFGIASVDKANGTFKVGIKIIGEGTEVYGKVYNSVIGCDVTIGKGAEVRDSILMNGTRVGAGSRLYKVISAENVTIGDGVVLGDGYEVPNDTRPDIYREGIVTLGEGTVIPAGVTIGKNVMISGETTAEDYPGSRLESGKTLVKEGDVE